MAEYIERGAFEKLMKSRNVIGNCKFCSRYEKCIDLTRKGSHRHCWKPINLPTADVAEVRNGEWLHGDTIDDGWTRYYCSECKWMTYSYYKDKNDLSKYCPNCGAKMDGRGEDHETD